ncbi:MAG: amidohydrolase family protein, partial [Gemmatimonadota bacterium]|nr:amidohydrolase family protein [Gemmatimonadota bacterium]
MMITADFEAYLTDDWYGQQITVDALLECEAEAGFEMAVVMPQTRPLPDNDGLLDKTAGHSQLLPCPLVDPHWGEEGIAALKDYVDRGAQGVKLMGAIHKYNVDDSMVIPFVETARDLGIVVSIHSGRDNCSAERIGNVARQVPGVPIIMDHMGFPDGFDTALEVCRECPDVYLGTTILRFHKLWAINPE